MRHFYLGKFEKFVTNLKSFLNVLKTTFTNLKKTWLNLQSICFSGWDEQLAHENGSAIITDGEFQLPLTTEFDSIISDVDFYLYTQ